jgi:hypothetical protein
MIDLFLEKPTGTNATQHKDRQVTIQRHFQIGTNNQWDGPAFILGWLKDTQNVYTGRPYAPLSEFNNRESGPVAGRLEYDKTMMITDIQLQQIDWRDWDLTITYSAYEFGKNGGDNPLLNPRDLAWSSAFFEKKVSTTLDWRLDNGVVNPNIDPTTGNQYVVVVANTFGDRIAGVVKDDSRPVLTIRRNEPTFDPFLATTYKGKVNKKPFFKFPAYCAKMHDITASPQYHQLIGRYWSIQYEIHFNIDSDETGIIGWQHKLPNEGFHCWAPDFSQTQRVKTSNGSDAVIPMSLKKDGRQLIPASGGQLDMKNLVWNYFFIYEPIDFDPLLLEVDPVDYVPYW